MLKKPVLNHQIRAREVRVIDETGKQLGLLPLSEALQMANERGLDLVQVTEKVDPPVCKLVEYGKFLYQQHKKEKNAKQHGGEVKGIRLTFGISTHDLEIRAQQAKKFLEKGDAVRIEMRLRGREKALQGFAKEKIQKFIENLQALTSIKIERQLKKEPRGLTMFITKGS